jgi:hypothetical protein
LIAVFTSTSAYIAPSVSRSRIAVNPFIREVRAAAVALIAGTECFPSAAARRIRRR